MTVCEQGLNPSCLVEGRTYPRYPLKNHPNAKIGVLYQNGDMGKDYLAGLRAGLGDRAKMTVAETSWDAYHETVGVTRRRLRPLCPDSDQARAATQYVAMGHIRTCRIGGAAARLAARLTVRASRRHDLLRIPVRVA